MDADVDPDKVGLVDDDVDPDKVGVGAVQLPPI